MNGDLSPLNTSKHFGNSKYGNQIARPFAAKYINIAETNWTNDKSKLKTKTWDVSAGDEQKPLSLDSPGFKRIAGVIN